MPADPRPARSHRRPRPSWPGRLPTVTEFVRLFGVALIYAVTHWVLTQLPLTIPVAERYYLNLRPGILVPLLTGLVAGPLPGLAVGVLGRLLGDVLSGAGATAAALVYSGLLGLVAGLGARPDANGRTLRTQARAALWVLLANVAAALASAVLVQTLLLGQFEAATGWDRAVSEGLSGVVSGLLLLPGALYLFGRRPPPRA